MTASVAQERPPGADPGLGRAGLLRRLHRQERLLSASDRSMFRNRPSRALSAPCRQPPDGGQAGRGRLPDVRLRLRPGADLPRHLRRRSASTCWRCRSEETGAGADGAVNGAGRQGPHHHGRVRCQRARPVGLQAGAGLDRRAPGPADDGDVRVPQPPEAPMAAQAIPSYAPGVAMSYFNKVECFCFSQHTCRPTNRCAGRWSSSSIRSCRRTFTRSRCRTPSSRSAARHARGAGAGRAQREPGSPARERAARLRRSSVPATTEKPPFGGAPQGRRSCRTLQAVAWSFFGVRKSRTWSAT